MTVTVHPSAVVDPRAALADDVVVGPYAVIGPGVEIGPRSEVQAHAIVERDTTIGAGCLVGYGAVLGSAPQDLAFRGTPSRVAIGDGTQIREYATIHRATAVEGVTRVGARCYVMAYVHVAHDCIIGDEVVLANNVQLAGHVQIGCRAWVGGQTPVHQFVRIGELAFVGGGSRVPQDIPPFACVAGIPLRLYGINAVGLRRTGMPPATRLALKHAFRVLFNSDRPVHAGLDELRARAGEVPEVDRLVEFVATSERGVLVG